MGKKVEMITGQRFGILTIVSEVEERDRYGYVKYNVICDCGKTKSVLGSLLRRGTSRSCGYCTLLMGTHGMSNSREFSIWRNMRDRCYNINNKRYNNYGGRGISVCERWMDSFANFIKDMGNSNGLSLDRIDVNGNYEPSNCRWTDYVTQGRNRSNNRLLTYNSETLCVSEWCERLEMSRGTFINRLNSGWSLDKIIKTPPRSNKLTKKY